MPARFNQSHLAYREKLLNQILCLPTEAIADGCWRIGNIHAHGCNGGYNIHQVCNDAGGVRALAYGLTLRQACEWLQAAAEGAEMMRRHSETGCAMHRGV